MNNKPLYIIWKNMRQRCNNPNSTFYNRYGGRGIGICKEWDIYKNFEKDMLPNYKRRLTLDRINNDGDYCKENCKWSTPKEQGNNRSDNTWITHNGITKTLSKWADDAQIKRNTLIMRYLFYGWSFEKCINTPVQKYVYK